MDSQSVHMSALPLGQRVMGWGTRMGDRDGVKYSLHPHHAYTCAYAYPYAYPYAFPNAFPYASLMDHVCQVHWVNYIGSSTLGQG